ncbi:SdrD B-like domain-containing protein, partial [Arthrospira platensis SPKY1]|nr:SdrD B-like domain-containing protein [Arthrospira platensis SPKY1]
NVTVTLYDPDTNALDTTTTDVNGFYSFTNLVPGTYFVGFTPPVGYQVTLQDAAGDDTLDSDADPITGYTIPTTLVSGENDPTWDAGLYQPASLGDFVWNDLNADGVQDGGETGVENVTVNLLTNGT